MTKVSELNKGIKKIVILGDGGVGKSTFLQRFRTGEFEQRYIPTMGVEIYPINFKYSEQSSVFNIWDCAGQEKFGGLGDGYYHGAHAAIVMFDVTSKTSYKNVPFWIERFEKINPTVHIIVCGNKVDCPVRKVKSVDIKLDDKYKYYDISSKSCYNFEKPFNYLHEVLNKLD